MIADILSLSEQLRDEERASTGLTAEQVRYLRDARDRTIGVGGPYPWPDSGTSMEQSLAELDLIDFDHIRTTLTDKGRVVLEAVDHLFPVEDWRAELLAERGEP